MPIEDIPTLPAFPDGFVPPDPFERRPGDTARQSWVRVWQPPPPLPFPVGGNGSQSLFPGHPSRKPGHDDFSIPRTPPPGFPSHLPSNGPPSNSATPSGFPLLPPGAPPPPSPAGLRVAFVGTMAANTFLIGAILVKVAHALCRPLPKRDQKTSIPSSCASTKVTFTLFTAASMVIVSLLLEAIVIPVIGFGSPISQGYIRLCQQWTLLLAVILMCGVAYRRAIALQSAWPRVKPIAQVSTGAFLFLAISTRGMATVFEVQAVTLQVSPFQTMWIRQVMRSVLNASAAVYMMFMEGVVTVLIFWYRDGYALNAAEQGSYRGGAGIKAPTICAAGEQLGVTQVETAGSTTLRKWYLCSPSARLRIIFSALISLVFVAQAILQVLNIWGIMAFAPFWTVGWSLFFIRLFEFRIELGSGSRRLPRPDASRDESQRVDDLHLFAQMQRQNKLASRPLDSGRPAIDLPIVSCCQAGASKDLTRIESRGQPTATANGPLSDALSSEISEEIVIICESPVASSISPWSPSPPPGIASRVPTCNDSSVSTSAKAAPAWELLLDVANQRWDGSLELGAHVRVERNQHQQG